MTRATGLDARKAYALDRESVLVGSVRAGEGSAAETRTAGTRLLPVKLNTADVVKFVASGGAANSAGGYIIKAAHVPLGGAIGDANPTGYATVGIIAFNGKKSTEIAVSGAQLEALVKAAASPAITGDVRVTALKLIPGSGDLTISNVALTSNVATVTVGAHTLQVGESVTVNSSNAVFNGTFTITAVDATTISYARTNTNVASAAAAA
jgi:hypothetical protein